MDIHAGVVTGEVVGDIFNGERKAELLKDIAQRENIALEQVIAMFQPLLARSFETSAPTPLLPPVTIATGLVIFIPPLQK